MFGRKNRDPAQHDKEDHPLDDPKKKPRSHDATYPLVNQRNYGKSPFLMGKSTINGPFSIAMLVYQRVI